MPELPEVETVRAALARQLTGVRISGVLVHEGGLRRPLAQAALAACCCGRRVLAVSRRGKYLILDFDRGDCLVVHLGMTGSFSLAAAGQPRGRHDHVEWLLADQGILRFNDPRRFGCITPARRPLDESGRLGPLPRLGPEPLSPGFSGKLLAGAARHRRTAVKNILLDQSVVAGIGNIYASEALFMAGLDPRRRADRVSLRLYEKLAAAVQKVLREAIAAGGTTISDFRSPDGLAGRFSVRLNVYGKAGDDCPRCAPGTSIRRAVIGGRSTFFCRRCQR